jgi:hypothetical protein
MYLEDRNLFSGKVYDKPKIHWNEDDKYAIIAFLLMSIDKKIGEDGKVRLDDLFGLDGAMPEPEGEEGGAANDKREARDTIISECERFLAGLSDDERYDAVQDEIDKFIEGTDSHTLKCAIGDSYGTFGNTLRGKLYGGNYRLWELVKLVVFDDDYNGNKRRLLKHLARKWDIDGSVLPILEEAAKSLSAIERERQSLVESGRPFREVATLLVELAAQEKETWKKLKKLGVDIDESRRGIANAALSLAGLLNPDLKDALDNAEDEDDENEERKGKEEYEEPGIGDKIADGICFGIEKVTDLICAPFEWMTDKLMGL